MLVDEVRFTRVAAVEVARVEESPVPGPNEVVVAPSWVGICGSDLHVLHGRHPFVEPPVVTGHETSAVVVQAGSEVDSFAAGDRVLINPLLPCGQCEACDAGVVNTCEQAKVLGFKLAGTARTRRVLPAGQLHSLPGKVPLDLACLAEPLATAVHAIRRVQVSAALGPVLVVGGGPIGMSVLMAARVAGASSVTLVDPVAVKREMSRLLEADHTLSSVDLAPRRAFTTVFDCVANPVTLGAATEAAVGGGRVVVVGVPNECTLDLALPRMQRFEVDLLGSGMYLPRDVDRAIGLIAASQVDPNPLISARFDLTEATAAYATATDPELMKVLLRLDAHAEQSTVPRGAS